MRQAVYEVLAARAEPRVGRVWSDRQIRKAFETVVAIAQLDDFRFHDLRHTFASNFVMRGGALQSLKEILGHGSMAMTLRYAHLAPEHVRGEMERTARAHDPAAPGTRLSVGIVLDPEPAKTGPPAHPLILTSRSALEVLYGSILLCIIGGDDMLTAEGIVGKVVAFIAEKVVSRLAALPFDRRRKACRSLTKLYYCVQALDEATERILDTLESWRASGDASAVVNALNNHRHDVEHATNMFIYLGHELYPGLQIIDPVLAECCHTLYISKGDFLSFLSNSIRWDRSGSKARIVVKRPLGRMDTVDMEHLYDQVQSAFAAGQKHYWPSSALDDFADDFDEISIGFEDEEAAAQLEDLIRRQNVRLKAAKEQLRNLLIKSCLIEEILFQTDTHPYR